jgi:hypothetical protein
MAMTRERTTMIASLQTLKECGAEITTHIDHEKERLQHQGSQELGF